MLHVRCIIEPIIGGYFAWAEVVGGPHDGAWSRLHYIQWVPEIEMCQAAWKHLDARLKEEWGHPAPPWDGEITMGTRRKKEEDDGPDDS